MYICPLKQTGFFVVSLRFPLVIPVEELSIGREADWEISITSALPGTSSTVQINRHAGILVLGTISLHLDNFYQVYHQPFMQNEILELWKCFLIEFERFAVHFPLWHTLFLLILSRHLCYIYYWSISLLLHVTSYVHWEKVNPGKICYQLYLGATEVSSAMKVNMLFCIFWPQKSYTVHLLKEGKNSLAHTVLGHGNIVTGCLPQYLLLVYNSSLKTET